MKKEDLVIRCIYTENAKPAEQILIESFRLFLQRELDGLAKGHDKSD